MKKPQQPKSPLQLDLERRVGRKVDSREFDMSLSIAGMKGKAHGLKEDFEFLREAANKCKMADGHTPAANAAIEKAHAAIAAAMKIVLAEFQAAGGDAALKK